MTNQPKLDELTERMSKMISKKTRQVRRIRRALAIAWIIVVALFFVGGFMEISRGRSLLTQSLAVIVQPMLLIAVILTVSWYVRSVDIRFVHMQAALSTIQEGLDALLKKPTDMQQQ